MTTILKSALYAGVAGLLMTSGAALAQSTQGNPGTTSPGTTTPGTTSPSTVPGTTSPGVIAPDPTVPDPDAYGDISPEAGSATGSAASGTEEDSMTGTSRYQRDKAKEREERELRQNPPTQGPEL